MDRRVFFLPFLFFLTGCKSWSDLSYGQRFLINNPELIEITGEGVAAGADVVGTGIAEISECVVELKEKALDESKYRGFIECTPK